jgi:hypothetical protein
MNPADAAHFGVLTTSLRAYHDGIIDGSFQATGFVLLVLGWLLTSKEARAYLGSSAQARRLAALALAFGTIVYASITWRAFVLSESVFAQLNALNYVPARAYLDQRLSLLSIIVFIAQNTALTSLTCYLMLTMKPARSAPMRLLPNPGLELTLRSAYPRTAFALQLTPLRLHLGSRSSNPSR